MLVRASLVKAEQDSSIHVDNLAQSARATALSLPVRRATDTI
jgi:hypothetical protein